MKKLLLGLMLALAFAIQVQAATDLEIEVTIVDSGWTFIWPAFDTSDGNPADTLVDKVVWEWAYDTLETLTRYDSIVGGGNITQPDSAAAPITNLRYGTTIFIRAIANDTSETDTSLWVSTTTWSPPMGFTLINGSWQLGNNGRKAFDLWRFGWKYNYSTHTFYSDTINISEYGYMDIHLKLFGYDNNHTFDSTYVAIKSHDYYSFLYSDTLIAADEDTATYSEDFDLRTYAGTDSGGTNPGHLPLKNWGPFLSVEAWISDSTASGGDTKILDWRYMDGFIIFKK